MGFMGTKPGPLWLLGCKADESVVTENAGLLPGISSVKENPSFCLCSFKSFTFFQG